MELPRDRMAQVLRHFELLEVQMAAGPAPDVYVKLAAEYSELQEIAGRIRELRAAEAEEADLKAMLADKSTDAEMRELAELDLPDVEQRIEALQKEIDSLRQELNKLKGENAHVHKDL